ncbi:S8 family peptidase [Candidatus Poribacteria bacterium]|nr:S8 family peptidase [Candidatus Poribacteria bacterium]
MKTTQNVFHAISLMLVLVSSAIVVSADTLPNDNSSYHSQAQPSRILKIHPRIEMRDSDKLQPVWILFTDKGSSTKVDSRTNETDLSVEPRYIDAVLQIGGRLRSKSRWLNAIGLEAKPVEIRAIARLPFVREIHPILKYTDRFELPVAQSPTAPPAIAPLNYGTSRTQVTQMKADFLHQEGFFGEGMVVGLLDTGFSLAHTALQHINVIAQHDFVNDDDNPADEIGQDDSDQDDHGSIVLGILAGNAPGNLIGVAYRASYLLAKTEKVSENGQHFERLIEEDWWIEGLEWIEEMGADVVISSLGYSDWYRFKDLDGKTSKLTIAANLAVEKGMAVVVAAGNQGNLPPGDFGLPGRITVPADGIDVLAIGAVDAAGRVPRFNSRGPTFDGRIKPDLMAMGSGVTSINSLTRTRFSSIHRGTSVATPLAAGVVTLLLQAFPLATPQDIAHALRSTASQSHKPDNVAGYGIINARAAYEMLLDQFGQTGIPEPVGVETPTNSLPVTLGNLKRGLLLQNYPNPFNAETWIPFRLFSQSQVTIRIYDLHGSLINAIVLGDLIAGDYSSKRRAVYWNGRNFYGEQISSGSYFYTLELLGETHTQKMIVLE